MPESRIRMTSLEGVWRTAVRAVELESLMLVSSRGYPLLTMVNGPLMAWRSWELYGAAVPSPADWLTCGSADKLTVRDRDCPRWFLLTGT